MALKAIIIRLEGAVVDMEAIERRAINRVLADAGYNWSCSESDYAKVRRLASRDARLAEFVTQRMHALQSGADIAHLIDAMRRALAKTVVEMVEAGDMPVRPCVAALLNEARRDGIPVGLASTLGPDLTERAKTRAFGSLAAHALAAVEPGNGHLASAEAVYAALVERLGVSASDCLAIEATEAGLHAALAVGLPVVITRGAYAAYDNLDAATFVMDDLRVLVPGRALQAGDLLDEDSRAELMMSLSRLHAGIIDIVAGLDRSKHVMKVEDILKKKGYVVKTIGPHETIWSLALRLRTDAVGALVVVGDDKGVRGIISERDLARGLAEHGAGLVDMRVEQLMTKSVITCQPEDSIGGVSKVMTQRRIRHLPVMRAGQLVGLVSIGDVLGHRLDQMEQEMNVLRDYAIARS
ncbi:MAG: CBS domain-containing protein [Hyphomicrobium sp.]|nr:CBS domain-containing protein [Hyphomicrobium sp.]